MGRFKVARAVWKMWASAFLSFSLSSMKCYMANANCLEEKKQIRNLAHVHSVKSRLPDKRTNNKLMIAANQDLIMYSQVAKKKKKSQSCLQTNC